MSAPEVAAHTGPVSDQPTGPFGLPRREEATALVQQSAIADLADMSEVDFNKALERAKVARQRVEHILDHVLIPGAHFGNPEVDGKKAFKHPILFLAGAEALVTMFRLQIVEVMGKDRETIIVPPTLDATTGKTLDPGFVSITVTYGISMASGAITVQTTTNCNSREKRFRRFSGQQKWTYEDARETIHDCLSIAIKRAVVRLVRGALGLTPWLATEEEMEAAADREAKKLLTEPWTKADRERVYAEARKAGIDTKGKFAAFVQATLGRSEVGQGEDVAKLLLALKTPTPSEHDPLDEDEDEDEDDILAQDRAVVEREERGARGSRASATARSR